MIVNVTGVGDILQAYRQRDVELMTDPISEGSGIYFLADLNEPRLKIGLSKQIRIRVPQIESRERADLCLMCVYPCKESMLTCMEKLFHHINREDRIDKSSEWFRYNTWMSFELGWPEEEAQIPDIEVPEMRDFLEDNPQYKSLIERNMYVASPQCYYPNN